MLGFGEVGVGRMQCKQQGEGGNDGQGEGGNDGVQLPPQYVVVVVVVAEDGRCMCPPSPTSRWVVAWW